MNDRPAPRLFYGYYVAFACFAIMFILYGSVLNTFTIFLKPMVEDLGWSRAMLSVAMAVGALGMGISAPIAGRLIDRLGARPVMVVGALMIGGGVLAASRIQHPWQIYLVYAFIGAGLASATIIPCSLIISNWFISRRGMAMGIMAMGTSVGGMFMTPVANWIIQNHGWRMAYVVSGTIILLVGVPIIAFVLKPHPSDMGLEPHVDPALPAGSTDNTRGFSVKEAIASKVFWQIAAVMFIIGVVTSAWGTHCAAHLNDLGHSPTSAAYAWSFVLLVMTVAKFAFGPISDRWGAKNAMAVACVLVSISILIVSNASAYSTVLLFAALYGFGVGAPLTINPLLTSGTLGMKNFGAIFGILNLIAIVGAGIGPVWAGVAFDRDGSYASVLYIFAALMLLTAGIAFRINTASRRSWEAGEAQPADVVD